MWQKFRSYLTELGVAITMGSSEVVFPVFNTSNLKTIQNVCSAAQQSKSMYCVCGDTRLGKTLSLKQFNQKNKSAYYVLCQYYMTDNMLLNEIIKSLGVQGNFSNKVSKFEGIIFYLRQQTDSVLLLDDVGKLPLICYRTIQLLYDKLVDAGVCGMVITGTSHLATTLRVNAEKGKMSFPELVARIRNKKWSIIGEPSSLEIKAICEHFYIDNKEVINYLSNTAKEYQFIKDVVTEAVRVSGELGIDIDINLIRKICV